VIESDAFPIYPQRRLLLEGIHLICHSI